MTVCTICGKELVAGQLRRHEDHFDCWDARRKRLEQDIEDLGIRRRARRSNGRPADIKAPDGYVLGGTRKVRKDGTILLCNCFYQCPVEWAGKWLSCHIEHTIVGHGPGDEYLAVAMDEGMSIFEAQVNHRDRVYQAWPADKPSTKNRTVENMRRRGVYGMKD